MTCQELADVMDDYVAGELNADARQQFERHLTLCPNCQKYLRSYRESVSLVKRLRGVIVVLLAAALCASACARTEMPTAPTPPVEQTMAGSPAPAPTPPVTPAPPTARYRATFLATWSTSTHAVDFPSSAHFSPLVGGTHTSQATFWREGALATDGIRNMAERGATTTLSQEVAAAMAAGTAERVVLGGSIDRSPGSATADFEISQSFPLVTLVSMIAPSPDWFVGVSGLALFENGQWIDERRVPLDPWDAGTDSGATFTSSDFSTRPQQPIMRIVTSPLSPGGRVTPLGTFTFTRLP